MLFPGSSSSAFCGTGSSINPASLLGRLASPLLPGCLTGIGNTPLQRSAVPEAADRVGEMAAVLQGVTREVIDWGRMIAASRALHAAERLVPGVTLPYTAYLAYTALSAAARGQVARAVCSLPLNRLVPAQALRLLADTLHPLLPEWTESLLDHEPLILGLATCVLLHQQLGSGPRVTAPSSARVRAVLRLLAGIRCGMNVLAGLRGVMRHRSSCSTAADALLPPPRASGAASEQARPPEGAAQRLQYSFPLAAARIDMACRNSTTSNAISAWPLPGAHSHRTASSVPSSKVVITAARMHAGAGLGTRSGKPGRPGKPRTGAAGSSHRRRLGTMFRRHGHQGGPEAGTDPLPRTRHAAHAGRSPGADIPDAEQDKARAALARAHEQSRGAVVSSDWRGAARMDVPPAVQHPDQSPAGCRPERGGVVGGNVRACSRPLPPLPLPPVRPASPPAPAPVPSSDGSIWVPACLRFRHADVARLQLKKTVTSGTVLRFCVHANHTREFEQAFSSLDRGAGGTDWLATAPVREDLPDEMRGLRVRLYGGLGKLRRAEPRPPSALTGMGIYSVLTLVEAIRDDTLRQPVSGARILAKNSFKLIEHVDLAGRARLHVVFHIDRSSPVSRRENAGFIAIERGTDGGYAVEEPTTGLVLQSEDLEDLVAALQAVSGCRFQADGRREPEVSSAPAVPMLVRTTSLLVLQEEPHVEPSGSLPDGRASEPPSFFSLTPYESPQHNLSGYLHPASFSILGDRVFYVDANATFGMLHLRHTIPPSDWRVMGRPQDDGAGLGSRCGLFEGRGYLPLTIVQMLEECGLSWLPVQADARPRSYPDGLPVDVAGQTSNQHQETPWFTFDGDVVVMNDAQGRCHELWFAVHGHHRRDRVIASSNDEDAITLAASAGLRTGVRYAEDEISTVLRGSGREAREEDEVEERLLCP